MEIRAIGTEGELKILCARFGVPWDTVKKYSAQQGRCGSPVDADRQRIYLRADDETLRSVEHDVLLTEASELPKPVERRVRM